MQIEGMSREQLKKLEKQVKDERYVKLKEMKKEMKDTLASLRASYDTSVKSINKLVDAQLEIIRAEMRIAKTDAQIKAEADAAAVAALDNNVANVVMLPDNSVNQIEILPPIPDQLKNDQEPITVVPEKIIKEEPVSIPSFSFIIQ